MLYIFFTTITFYTAEIRVENSRIWVNPVELKIDYEILIVGAGVVGATLAFLLAKQGIQTCLVDQRNTQDYSKKNYFTGRTASLNLSSIELFEKIGIWKNLSKFSLFLLLFRQLVSSQIFFLVLRTLEFRHP